jgi:hypothetical protein
MYECKTLARRKSGENRTTSLINAIDYMVQLIHLVTSFISVYARYHTFVYEVTKCMSWTM